MPPCKLDRLLPDMAAGAADLHLGGGDRLAALDRVFLGGHHGGEHGHAARLFHRHQHIHRAVLQHLERPDRPAELLAGFQVFQRQVLHRLHRADRLGAERGDRLVDHVLDQRQRVVAEQVVGGDTGVGQGQFRGALAVLGRVAAAGDAGRGGIDQEQADAVAVAPLTGQARGDEDAVGRVAVDHDAFGAVQDIAAAVLARPSC